MMVATLVSDNYSSKDLGQVIVIVSDLLETNKRFLMYRWCLAMEEWPAAWISFWINSIDKFLFRFVLPKEKWAIRAVEMR